MREQRGGRLQLLRARCYVHDAANFVTVVATNSGTDFVTNFVTNDAANFVTVVATNIGTDFVTNDAANASDMRG
jgi:hypothetical protein